MAVSFACTCSELQMIELPEIFFNEVDVRIFLQALTKSSNIYNKFIKPVYS